MSAAPISQTGQSWHARWLGQGRWQAAVLVLTAVIGFISWSPRQGDFAGYLQVGQAVLNGADIYRDTPAGVNTWPPFFSVASVPLALVDQISSYLATSLWVLLNYLVLVQILGILSRLIYDRRLTVHRIAGPAELSITSAAVLVPLALTSPYLAHNFEYLQINLLLFGLTLAGLYQLQGRRELWGAAAVGMAAALKVMPVVFLAYLAFRRAWKPLRNSALAVGLLSLSPILVFGWDRFWHYVAEWRVALDAGWGVGFNNQSVFAMWDRLIGHHLTPFTAPGGWHIPASGNPAVRVAWALTLALVALVSLRQFRIAAPDHPRVRAAEWSVVFIVSAIFGPVAWKFYFVVLLLPYALLFALWRESGLDRRSRRLIGGTLLGSGLLSFTTAHDLVGQRIGEALEQGSVATLSMLLTLSGLLWLRGRPELLTGPRGLVADPAGAPVDGPTALSIGSA